MSAQQIEAAILAIKGHPNPQLAVGLAEGMTLAYFTSQRINAEQFKQFCARLLLIWREVKGERHGRD